ncbi:MAG TPA: glycosyltransferase family 4 protein [Candidatus Saccharimonadales bacterium]|nr:glycosyltransferase family 4 protein [Candidatus Saccharimonadales bacterium]
MWSARYPFLAGAGGSENYTAGHVRELLRRGIPSRIIVVGHEASISQQDFPDIPFLALKDAAELQDLDDTLIFVTYPLDVTTKKQSYAILHCPPPAYARGDRQYDLKAFRGKKLIAASRFSGGLWRRHLRGMSGRMSVVYPFASPAFAAAKRPGRAPGSRRKILFAGRLTPDKGIYTLMASLHMDAFKGIDYELAVTTAGAHTEEGRIVHELVKAHPLIKVVPACKDAVSMAKLMAQYDVVVMPSTDIFWQELFGIVSVEAQHAGCRVVASRSGGLPETNVGGLLLVQPDNPKALAGGIVKALQLGPLSSRERAQAAKQFTLESSVDALLKTIRYNGENLPHERPRGRRQTVLQHLRPRLAMSRAGALGTIGTFRPRTYR